MVGIKGTIIGSAAIKYWFKDFNRNPKDIDIIKSDNDLTFISWAYPNNLRREFLDNDILKNYSKPYLDPNTLYTLKMSHLFWDINWDKHMFDVQFLKKKNCILNKELFFQLYDYWNTYHTTNRRSKLNMSADEFFDNALKSEYKHDLLHTLLNPIPTYLKVLKDKAEVDVCEIKFNSLSFEDKCALVTEEVMIMAYERYKDLDYRLAYSKMLKKFIINHAPLWEAIFIIENFIVLHKPKHNYYKQIENGLSTIK